jgi:hypothetical protein
MSGMRRFTGSGGYAVLTLGNIRGMEPTVLGVNGRRYPAHRRTDAELGRLIRLAHHYRCAEGLSYRTIERRIAGETGAKVSQGQVFTWCQNWTCQLCEYGPTAIRRPAARPWNSEISY